MASVTEKQKLQEQAVPTNVKILKERSYSNPDIKRIQMSILEQMEESVYNTGQIWTELDSNHNGIMDILEDNNIRYLFDAMPITQPIKDYFKKIEQYFLASERQKEKLIRRLIEVLDYGDKTREVTKLVPVDATRMGQEDIDRFKSLIKSKIIAYKEDRTRVGRQALLYTIKQEASNEEKKVWVNSVAIEVLGEEILK